MNRTAQHLAPEEIEQQVRALGEWFHNLDLHGIKTAPDHFLGDYPRNKWHRFANSVPGDLRGRTVLDIGCNGGFYSIEMKRRGADRVVGIDSDERYLRQASFAARASEVDIEFRLLSVYDVAALRERFDIVLFMGVFYHLRHPLLALDLIHDHVARDLLIYQSMQRGSSAVTTPGDDYPFSETMIFEDPGFPRMHFIEKSYSQDRTNWWIPNRACVEAMLRSAGFDILEHPEDEVYICRCRTLSGPSFSIYPARAEDSAP